MKLNQTTPVPNKLFDSIMGEISSSALRVYLKIIRNTYGWRDEKGNPKKRDWISHSQFTKVGLSNRSITNAIDELLEKNLIILTDYAGNQLVNSKQRKKAQRIYYSITNNHANNTFYNANTNNYKAQILRPTKEIYLPKYKANERVPDSIRIEQIKQEQQQKQLERDSWL